MNNTTALLSDIKLRFNIEHPSFEECYAFGYECALQDINESENPFPADSRTSEHWSEGWWAGFYGEEPLHQLNDMEQIENEPVAANDHLYYENMGGFFIKLMEITGVIAVSAVVGLQVLELVA